MFNKKLVRPFNASQKYLTAGIIINQQVREMACRLVFGPKPTYLSVQTKSLGPLQRNAVLGGFA
jgi:hypothetical protein